MQPKICDYFETPCEYHENRIEIVPDSPRRAREQTTSVSQKQTSLESYGVDQFVKARRDK
jgi:hypothetical protein